jgi:ABC-2 type transport system permease protein
MKKTLRVAREELHVMTRQLSFRIMTVLIPLLGLLAVLGFMAFQAFTDGGEPEMTEVGYVDMAGMVTGSQQQGNVSFVPFESDGEARKALLADEIERYYVIPSDYLATGQVDEYTREKGFFPSESGRSALNEFMLANVLSVSALEPVPEQVVQRIRQPVFVNSVRLDERGEQRPPPDYGGYAFFFVLSILLIMAIFTSAGTLLQGIGEEKENRIMEVLLSSLTPGQLMAGKILGLGAAGLVQIVIWVVAGWGILALASGQVPAFAGISLPGATALLGVLYFVLGYALFGTLFACVGAVTPTAREGNQLVPIFVIPCIIPFYASVAIQGDPAGPFSRILTLFPLTSPVTVMVRLAASGIEVWEIAASALILTVSTLLALWVAGRIFGAYLLMYGKRPSVREIWHALRGA